MQFFLKIFVDTNTFNQTVLAFFIIMTSRLSNSVLSLQLEQQDAMQLNKRLLSCSRGLAYLSLQFLF